MVEWFANETFWVDFYDFLFHPSRFEEAEAEITKILNLVQVGGKEVLDLCCGPGRHTVAMAKRAYQVVGVDKSKYLLSQAKDRCSQEKVTVKLIESDMREYVEPNRFDLVLNLFTSFGYFKDPGDDAKVVQNIFQSLRKSGKVLLETMGKEIIARIFLESVSTDLDNGKTIIQRHKIKNNWSEIENEWIILQNEEYKKYVFTHRLYSAVELVRLFEDNEFKNIQIFGNLDGDKYDNESQRLILVAEK